MKKKRVYLDYGAATYLLPAAEKAMRPYLTRHFANPAALYREADVPRKALENARKAIAKIVHVRPHELVFTSGSTESNNLAILGYCRAQQEKGTIITTAIEHSSIRGPLEVLAKEGWNVAHAPINSGGHIIEKEFKKLLLDGVKLVTFAWANPDIGTLQDVITIGRLCRQYKAAFHVDASQAGGIMPLVSASKAADLLTISSAKVYGPRGIGALAVRSHLTLTPLTYGGGHERGLRPGTENVAGAVGFWAALEQAEKTRKKEEERLRKLRDICIHETIKLENVILTGSTENRLANHASFVIKDADGEELVVRLDARGVAVGTGSACATGEDKVSEAVKAIGTPKEYQRGTLRVTLGAQTKEKEVRMFVAALKSVLEEIKKFNGGE